MSQFRTALLGRAIGRRPGWVGAALATPLLASALAAPAAHAADQPPAGGYTVGDFNGDGFKDFVADDYRRDHVDILFGSATPGAAVGLDAGGTGVRLDLTGLQDSGQSFTWRGARRVGDFDKDGFDDVALQGYLGKAYVAYGAAGAGTIRIADGDPRVTTLLDDSAYEARGSYGIGDFNGDGYKDLIHTRNGAPSPNGFPNGGAVVVLGGPRVAQLDTRGAGAAGARRIQLNGRVSCRWTILVALPYWVCNLDMGYAAPIGDYNGDGKDDLFQTTGSFVIPGRSSTATINTMNKDALAIALPVQPAGDPWSPRPDPQPTPDPSQVGTDGWTLSGVASKAADGSVNLAAKDYANVAGAIYDARKTIDATDVQVDADLTLFAPAGFSPGNGVTVAFAAKGEGGGPTAGNPGLGLGWVTNKGIAIALGTVKGSLTPSNNYVAIANGVVGRAGYPTLLQSAPAVSPLANSTTHVTVRSKDGVVTVSLNGVERLRRTMAMPSDAYVGFTGGVSTNRQDHIIKNVVITKP